jgi:hypothetical protein
MSKFADAGQLAFTKLKTRRIRLTITVIISSILFCVLLATAFTVNGTLKSVEKFRGNGFGNRYIVSEFPIGSPYVLLSDKKLVAKAKVLQKQLVASKKAEAKRLNINYDPATETPFVNDVEDGPGSKHAELNTQVPQVAALLATKLKTQPGSSADFEKTVKKYGATGTYASININSGGATSGPPTIPYLAPLKDGNESFGQQPQPSYGGGPDANGIASINYQWQLFSEALLKPFKFEGQNLKSGDDGSIPIIAPYSAAEQMLKLKALPATASSAERLERLKLVRAKAAGYELDICYRNQVSNDSVQQAIQQQQEIKANKSTKGYVTPDLVTDLPSKACGPVKIVRDKRSAEQKKYDANQALFNKKFGAEDPTSKILHFRIIGINSDMPQGGSVSVTEVFRSILQSSLGAGWITPLELASPESTLSKIFGLSSAGDSGFINYAELNSSANLERLLNEQNCQPNFDIKSNPSGNDPYKQCYAKGKYFTFSPFGSSSVAIDHFKKGFDKAFLIAGLVISIVAAIILMGTIGRIIADSRRETAVFRAIGAKRRDIAQVYFLYTLMVALLIAAASTVLGYAISQFINGRYSPSVTVDALVAFNVSDLSQKFSMSSLYLKDVVYVSGLIIAAALLASLLPLVTNLRRNPIRDMRDER